MQMQLTPDDASTAPRSVMHRSQTPMPPNPDPIPTPPQPPIQEPPRPQDRARHFQSNG